MLTLAQLADLLHGVEHGDAHHAISSLSSLTRATAKDIVYFDNPLLKADLAATRAGIVLLKSEHVSWCPVNSIAVSNPLEAISKVAQSLVVQKDSNAGSIHPTASVHPSAQLGKQIAIGAYAVINEGVSLADGATIGAHTIIESAVHIGKNCQIGNNVAIHSQTQIGDQVVIHSGCIIGASPFNYLKQQGCWQQGMVLGGVTIADAAHIGANTVIDHGSVGDTYIGQGVCIDNLVQIAHDVFVGANTAIAGCAAIGAHASIGTDCIIGGASSIAAFVHLTNDVVISGMSTVSKSLAKAGIYSSGTLVHEHQRWRRNAARFRRLDDYIVKLGVLERKMSGDNS